MKVSYNQILFVEKEKFPNVKSIWTKERIVACGELVLPLGLELYGSGELYVINGGIISCLEDLLIIPTVIEHTCHTLSPFFYFSELCPTAPAIGRVH